MAGSRRRRDELPYKFRVGAESVSTGVRRNLGFTPHCKLDTDVLVEHLGLPLVALTEFATQAPRAVFHLYTEGQGKFSAAAVCDGTEPLAIVFNDAHEPVRQRADIAHECAHLILKHEPSAVFDESGRRHYPERLEAEATWLGPTLLVPRQGLLDILKADPRLETAAAHFDVSVPLVRYVYNTRGCSKVVKLAA